MSDVMIPLSAFLKETETRIPTVEEMAELCDTLGIKFSVKDGKPVLLHRPENKPEALTLAKLFRREPFRSTVIKLRLGEVKELAPRPEKGAEYRCQYDAEGKPFLHWFTGYTRWYTTEEINAARIQWLAADRAGASPGSASDPDHKRNAEGVQGGNGSEPGRN